VQSLSAAQWVKFGCTGYDAPIQLHTSHPHGESPSQMAAAAFTQVTGRGWTGFMNDLERYLHCGWLKTSYSANKVIFCK